MPSPGAAYAAGEHYPDIICPAWIITFYTTRYITPALLVVIFLNSVGIIKL
jgi:hypothetical protein